MLALMTSVVIPPDAHTAFAVRPPAPMVSLRHALGVLIRALALAGGLVVFMPVAQAETRRHELIYGADGSETRNSNDIFKIVRESTSERIKGLPFIYQSCGTEDFLIANNREFLALMNEKKIAHEYREHPGIHDWVFWNDQVREFLAVADRRLRK